ncbi:MAG TPA: GNAT family N-acetyltransferase [Solirubrobacteraceae bacterium]|nr:GNAT family N-acetyltransferase [Solirubrobacteraceae bacterium]
MTESDIPPAATVSAEAFELDLGKPGARHIWEARIRHSLRTDPEGSFVSERDGIIAGVAQAVVRERLWILSLLTVSPTRSRGGEGRALVRAALGYERDTDAGVIIASNDSRALRLYGTSGFRLEPSFQVTGSVDATLIPELHPDITEVQPLELERLAPISRAVRGAAHTLDLGVALMRGASIYCLGDRGFVVTTPGRGVWALAARDEGAAQALLWYGLHQLRDERKIEIGFVTGRQQWAIDVFLAARLPFRSYGAVATHGNLGPLHPYIPSPPFA